jgi:hypothetical protein
MRFYKIVISDPRTGKVFVPNQGGKPGFSLIPYTTTAASYTSLIPGASVFTVGGTNPAAQQVEVDLPVSFMHLPLQNGFVKIYGVSIAEIAQASNLNGMNVAVYGGMATGLPLANPNQAQKLVEGQIQPAFGNWIDNDQTLSLYVSVSGSSPSSNQVSGQPNLAATTIPVPATNAAPANLTWQWSAGQPFSQAVVNALQTAYPKYKIQGATLSNLVWTSGQADTGFFASLQQFAQYLSALSQKIIGGVLPDVTAYPGVSITLLNNVITLGDGSVITAPKQIEFTDLIGQPTWGASQNVQVTCRMRGDINPGDYVKLPNTPGLSQIGQGRVSQASTSQYFNVQPGSIYSNQSSGSIFTGTFQVSQVRHVGKSRQPDSLAWLTTLDMYLASNIADATVVQALPVLYAGNAGFKYFLPQ